MLGEDQKEPRDVIIITMGYWNYRQRQIRHQYIVLFFFFFFFFVVVGLIVPWSTGSDGVKS
jgi:hypothetical protein